MNIYDLMVGKTVMVMTELKVAIPLKIKKVVEGSTSYELTPSTRENDWYGTSQETPHWDVHFEGGGVKRYSRLSEINLVETTEILRRAEHD